MVGMERHPIRAEGEDRVRSDLVEQPTDQGLTVLVVFGEGTVGQTEQAVI